MPDGELRVYRASDWPPYPHDMTLQTSMTLATKKKAWIVGPRACDLIVEPRTLRYDCGGVLSCPFCWVAYGAVTEGPRMNGCNLQLVNKYWSEEYGVGDLNRNVMYRGIDLVSGRVLDDGVSCNSGWVVSGPFVTILLAVPWGGGPGRGVSLLPHDQFWGVSGHTNRQMEERSMMYSTCSSTSTFQRRLLCLRMLLDNWKRRRFEKRCSYPW
ncbi:hypothetical protein HOY82DRAFT_128158 [Tuber indicum]|nr:hypothetical protein HOY82DRAFT_128158 [Tuber indicum]